MAEVEKTQAPKAPQDRKPSKAASSQEKRKQKELLAEFMTAGIDFTPFTVDAGDGVVWSFTADPMPEDTERLRKGMVDLDEATRENSGVREAFDSLVEAIKARLIDEKQKKQFPLPVYGQNAIMFFALHLATGRDGFPTEED